MQIKFNDTTIELNPSFANIQKVEQEVGSIFEFPFRLKERKVTLCNIVNVYYFLQSGTAYTQDYIMERVVKDGMTNHMVQISTFLSEIITGRKTKKKEQPNSAE